MSVRDILSALRTKDYHAANESFARVMQSKLAERMAVEKQTVSNQMFKEDVQRCTLCSCDSTTKKHGFSVCDFHAAHGESEGPCPKCHINKMPSGDAAARLKNVVREAHMPAAEVQRVYDETHDKSETEILCGVSKLRVNENGQVISFINEAISRPNTSGQGYDDDYMNNPYHGVIRKYGYQYSHSTPVTVNGVKGVRHTYKQGDHFVAVFGNSWDTNGKNGVARPVYGGHPNTARAGADLERHLLDKARRHNLEH